MAIYSFYSSVDPDGKQGQVIQSAELEQLPVLPLLHELATLQALTPAGPQEEMMSYLLYRDGCSVFGLSFSEKRTISGTNREVPCSLQYVTPEEEMVSASADLGKIVNFINFQKPPASSPAPLESWPMIDSGYTFHNSTAVLTPLVDGLARVATSPGDTVMLIGLPKGKKNAYAFARYTIAEMLEYLPEQARTRIRFFTGLPVAKNITDPGTGFDTAVRYGANVIFCPNEFFRQIRLYRKCISVDMDQPTAEIGNFADFITHAPSTSVSLAAISDLVSGNMTYESLNKAAIQVKEGRAATVDKLREEISRKDQQIRKLGQQIEDGNRAYQELRRAHTELEAQPREPSRTDAEAKTEAPGLGKKILKRILIWFALLFVLGAGIYLGNTMMSVNRETAGNEQELKTREEQLTDREKALKTATDRLNADQAGLKEQQAALDTARMELEEEKQGLAEDRTALAEREEQLSAMAVQVSAMTGIRRTITADLAETFAREGVSVQVDSDGTVILDSNLLFESGKSVIRNDGNEILDRIIPVYLNVLFRDEYADYIGEITIEVHTNSTGSYTANLKLTQERALQIMLYCLDLPSLSVEQKNMLMHMMTAKGRSYGQLVYDANGIEDHEASRRVEIRFRLKDAEIIEEMSRMLGVSAESNTEDDPAVQVAHEKIDDDNSAVQSVDDSIDHKDDDGEINLYAQIDNKVSTGINLREKSSNKAEVLKMLKNGQYVWVIEKVQAGKQVWYHVMYEDNGNWINGYIVDYGITEIREDISAAYEADHPRPEGY